VGLAGNIVAQHEVVSLAMFHLVTANGARQAKDPPVFNIANHAAVAEDDLAGGKDDSDNPGILSEEGPEGEEGGRGTNSRTSARLPGRACSDSNQFH